MIRKLDCSKCGCNQSDKGLIALPVTYICHNCYRKEKAKEDIIKELKNLLGELYDYASYEKAGKYVLEDKGLQDKVKHALKG